MTRADTCKFSRLYEHEKRLQRMRDAALELYEALAIARNILSANGLPTGPKIDAALAKARGEQ